MNNSKSLLTIRYKLDAAQDLINSAANNQYYFFVSNSTDSNNGVTPFDNEQDNLLSSYQGMIFGKKINNTDMSLMIRRINWQANTIYDMYDHRSTSLYSLNFYVMVNEGTQWNVFKCLENGGGGPSTIAPSKTNVNSTGEDFFYPTDGYRWKYMYSVDDATYNKFATSFYFPSNTDANTSAQAVPGSLDVIKVESAGLGYSNYFDGTFGVQDIRLNGDPKRYGISNPGINTTNGYYDGCWLYITSGAGAGQYRLVDSYESNSTTNFVILTESFDSTDAPQNGSTFELSPSVTISGDGRQTLSAVARAIINSNGNTVSRVEVLNRGENYYHALANVFASGAVGVTSLASVTPIISPYGGHGSNPPAELGGKYIGFGVELSGSESNTITIDNGYSQIGILRNPLFNNVEITLTNQNKDFYTDETVYKITTSQLDGTAQTTLSNSQLTSTLNISGVNATNIVNVGSTILINYSTNYQLANVVSVSNTSIQLDKVALWDTGSGSANIYSAKVVSSGFISAFATGSVTLTNVSGTFQNGDVLIGSQTGVYGQANVVTVNGQSKTFNTFMQTYEYVGSINQGSFIPNEMVYQVGNPNANATFHSIEPDANTGTSRIFTINQWGVFNTAADNLSEPDQIKGATSGTLATLTSKRLPDLVYGSGEVVYVEYGDSITRSVEKTESFKIIFSF